ncbi:hypothetical protein [Mangrovibacterium diazotrophicum]|uniref:Quinol monooxygenase YgiN n=1 Tax=Mangrovibacterium diazotrophicum TaxID=1261403 RepID=A0A419W4N1_9BACT|nr:hypothetical protein [Mangrovibacterium diazotrophicum]RKD90413.1 hypothetical protein BC643_0751 [Mangrovibacterium diazotrophicum]
MAKAYLEITLKITDADRAQVVDVYSRYKTPFLQSIEGALTKELLVHVEDIQVLHSFNTIENAQEYLLSNLFNDEVVVALKSVIKNNLNIKIYAVA